MKRKKRIMPSQVINDNVTWKKATIDNTGWDNETYNKKYDVMRKRVRNYNLMYGTNYSPAQMLFYESTGKLYTTTQEIITTSTYREKEFKYKIASAQGTYKIDKLEKDFAGLLASSDNLRQTYQQLKDEGVGYDALYYVLANYADRVRREKEKDEHASYNTIQYEINSNYITFK